MDRFVEFVNKKSRESTKQLKIIKDILEREGMSVAEFLKEEQPYIYLQNPGGGLSFDGVRIYKIAGNIVYRVQKEAKTHPFGKAYPLDIEEMFDDLVSDNVDEEKAGKKIIKAVSEEFRNFFIKSAEAEKENRSDELDYGNISVGSSTGTDYSSLVHNTNN